MRFRAGLALAMITALANFLTPEFAAADDTVAVGIELPLSGDDGAAGLSALAGIRTAVADASGTHARRIRLIVRDTAHGGFRNPHRDEGTDDSDLAAAASASLAAFAKTSEVAIAIGGLRAHLAAADATAARGADLTVETLAPAPDPDCAALAAGTAAKAAPSFAAHSVTGAASLEALAVARAVPAGAHAVVVPGVEPDRRALAHCIAVALTNAHVSASIVPARHLSARGPIVAVGPRERGTLVCSDGVGHSAVAATLRASAHREYDSTTLPPGCSWIRYAVERDGAGTGTFAAFANAFRKRNGRAPDGDAVAGYAAGMTALHAIEAALPSDAGTRTPTARRLRRLVAVAAARGFAPFWIPTRASRDAACAGGNASGAWFERVTATKAESFFVDDRRCANR